MKQSHAINRRVFFRHAGAAVAGSFFLPGALKAAASAKGTARYVIFVNMQGAPAHTDTFDLKEGAWTLAAMEPTTYFNSFRWPRALFPTLADQLAGIVLLRSVHTYAVVHGVMQTWIQIGRNPLSGLSKIAPHIGSVVARELGDKNAVLPAFLSLNANDGPNQGYLDPATAPFYVTPGGSGLGNTTSSAGGPAFDRRYDLLLSVDAETRATAAIGPVVDELERFNLTARLLMYNDDVNKIFVFDSTERARYGSTSFGNACITARNLLRDNIGARFIEITLGGWDNHSGIYTGSNLNPTNAASTARVFDLGLGTLISDLKSDGLLDRTLIVAMGEFGRTTGALNSTAGRDHHMQQAVLVAGGGITGGRAIGSTDETGSKVVDPGWSANRVIYPEDLEATIYAALGIDYTTVYHDDPIGRGFALVPTNQGITYQPVAELWT
jgi:hypothetical protein